MSLEASCPLCDADGGDLVWRDADLRVIMAPEADYPGFVRVIWGAHAREMTDLAPSQRDHLMAVVWTVERVVRDLLEPDKVNVASLGNVVAHLHWHVIARWHDDLHFPAPIWGALAAGRDGAVARRREAVAAKVPALRAALLQALGGPSRGALPGGRRGEQS